MQQSSHAATGALGDGSAPGGPAERPDRQLLDACRAGDRDAWNCLVARYERLVFSVALRNGLGPQDAADVTQTTFLALLDSIDRIRAEERLGSWLMTVARRQAWRLRHSNTREIPQAEIVLEQPDPIVEWERSQRLLTAVAKLAKPCQDLIVALYLDPTQPSYAEISERLDRAIGGIGPMRSRCLARLRTLMGME